MKSIIRFIVFLVTGCLLINLFSVSIINAQPVDTVLAKLVAKNFFADRLSRSRQSNVKGISSQDIDMLLAHSEKSDIHPGDKNKGSHSYLLYYVFNVKNRNNPEEKNGFIIVSADQRVPAILGYSFMDDYSEKDLAPALMEWMDNYKEQIIYVIQNFKEPDPEIIDEWKQFTVTAGPKSTEQLNEVIPLLTSKWSQKGYYNNKCPADSRCSGSALNYHVPAGCVAVAMAQIMRYHQYPVSNNPIPGYTDDINYDASGNLIPNSAYVMPDVGVTTYKWSDMPDRIDLAMSPAPTSEAIDAVSTIIYHCGVASQMDYSPLASGTNQAEKAFKDYFKYTDIQDIDRVGHDSADWENILKNELDDNRPVYYSGYKNEIMEGGHAFVCDGYQDIKPYFHFNFGFGGGGGDGYYYIGYLKPGTNYDFRYKQWAIIGISPVSDQRVTDADGNHYDTIKIGDQTWFAENLKTTKYNDGTAIPLETNNTAWTSLQTPAYCWYDNDGASYKNIYGALYNWYAVNTGKLCPVGWHVPDIEEWRTLTSYLGGISSAGGKLKETGTDHWATPNTGATDEVGFTALPGGYRDGLCWSMRLVADFWTSTMTGVNAANDILLRENSATLLDGGNRYLMTGYSVRCIKGETSEGILPGDAGAFAFGLIGTEGEEKWYRFLTTEEGPYSIQTYGTTDTYMYLYGSDRTTLIAEDNDGAVSGQNSRILETLGANTLYFVKIKGFDSSVTGVFSINFYGLPGPPVGENTTLIYDGLSHQLSATVPSGISIVWYDSATEGNLISQPSGKDVGTYAAYAEAVNISTGWKSTSRTEVILTINPAPITIKANDAAKYCGQVNPVFSVTYTGFVNGENESSLGGTLIISSTSGEESGTGTFPVTPSGLTSVNYTITYTPGILTVNNTYMDATATSKPVAIGSDAITLSAKALDVSSNPIAGVKVWFSVENGAGQITDYPAVFTDISGIASLALEGLASIPDVFMVNAMAGTGCGSEGISTAYLAVYDPSGGFVTGGGWIISPAGAFPSIPSLTGKANFGFVAKYKRGSVVPEGNTEFRFTEGSLNFSSSSYEAGSLVIAGYKAIYKGVGTINGTGNFGFMVSAADGDVSGSDGYDKFRIKIWDKTDNIVVYDNNLGCHENDVPSTALGGGSIVIHKVKANTSKSIQITDFDLKVYPNPFTDHIYFDLQLKKDSRVSLEIFDINGTKLETIFDDYAYAPDHYTFEYNPRNVLSGILLYRLTIDGKPVFKGNLIHY